MEIGIWWLAVVTVLAVEIKRNRLRKPYSYWAIACISLAIPSSLMVEYESVYVHVCGSFLLLIFMLVFVCMLSLGTSDVKGQEFDSTARKINGSTSRHRSIAKLSVLTGKYPRAFKVLGWLSLGCVPVLFVVGIAATILSGMLGESHLVGAGDAAGTLAPGAVFGLSFVVGIVTLIVTFIFGLPFPKDAAQIGLSTGLWVGLIASQMLRTEAIGMRLCVAGVCVLCGYLGGNVSSCVRHGIALKKETRGKGGTQRS